MPANVITIKPAPGLRVLDPTTMQPLPPEGAQVEKNTHWIRRIKEGDVTLVTPPKPNAKVASAAKE